MRVGTKKRLLFILGFLFVVIGVFYNEWTLRRIFYPDPLSQPFHVSTEVLFNGLMVLLGLAMIRYRGPILRKQREILVVFLSLGLSLFFAEYGIRLFYLAKYEQPVNIRSPSDDLGWRTDENVHMKRNLKGYGEVDFSTGRDGFRCFGRVDTGRVKILVIGDSFTEAYQVSDGKAYYDVVREAVAPAVEIFAYGSAGYSSLQEYLILDRYFDRIRPDAVLWQMCSNDILENDYDLDVIHLRDQREVMRPYLIGDEIERRVKKDETKTMRSSLLLQKLALLKDLATIEKEFSRDNPLYEKAVLTTGRIMEKFKRRAGSVPVIAFCVDANSWTGTIFQDLCEQNGIEFVPGIPEAIEKARESGMTVDGSPYDKHWNAVGHAIVGKRIFEYLRERLMKAASRNAEDHAI